jgi:hypothetical protein
VRALRQFGATVDYLVPDRFKLGYGLTPELVDLAASAHRTCSSRSTTASPASKGSRARSSSASRR